MVEGDRSADVDRLLASVNFGEFPGAEQDEPARTTRLVRQDEELSPFEVAQFFLEERGFTGNLFKGTLHGGVESSTLMIRATARDELLLICFFEDPKTPDLISFGVYKMEDHSEVSGKREVRVKEPYTHFTLRREDIVGVRFEIFESTSDGELQTRRSVAIENAQGYSLRIDDNGCVQLDPFDDDEGGGKEGNDS